jgi:FAD:protein FMN transferase
MLLRRAKPLLGTLVEIAIQHEPAAQSQALTATSLAFKAVERIHSLMSRHEPLSELSQFNRLAVGAWLPISPDVWSVLAFANDLSLASLGLFDVFSTSHEPQSGCWRDLGMDQTNQRIRKYAPLVADLGGIAKGYAVDCAVDVLLQAQTGSGWMKAGWVNAGGDARVFGDLALPLHIRHPHNASCLLPQDVIQGLSHLPAVATSKLNGNGQTVWARSCMAADALTKILARTDNANHPVLSNYGAQAVIYA